MAKSIPDARIERYSTMRRALGLTLRTVAREPIIHGLVEFDVTEARLRIAADAAATGEKLSFTAFIVGCVAAAVTEYPEVHAQRLGRNRLIIYRDVDVAMTIERQVNGHKQPIVAVLRAANQHSVHELHAQIRRLQEAPVRDAWDGYRSFSHLPLWLFRLMWPPFWWFVRRSPELMKKYRGTVDVTSFGMFGAGGGWGLPVVHHTAIAVGGIAVRPAYVEGNLQPREMLSVTVSFNHILIDGAVAARFVSRLRQLVESAHGLPEIARPLPVSALES